MTLLRRLARRFGYDLVPRSKAKALPAQLVRVLERFEISCVLDVGANVGQYGATLREWGWRGRIVSFEPQIEAHRALVHRASADPEWRIAPRMALGEAAGELEIDVSAESDMSSFLPQTDLLRQVSPSSRVLRREAVPVRRLDQVADECMDATDRPFLKIDAQGYEPQVLAGASGILGRLRGIQLELSLVPCYEGERDFCEMIEALRAAGFAPWLVFPGYFERKLGRQLQIDGVFMREGS